MESLWAAIQYRNTKALFFFEQRHSVGDWAPPIGENVPCENDERDDVGFISWMMSTFIILFLSLQLWHQVNPLPVQEWVRCAAMLTPPWLWSLKCLFWTDMSCGSSSLQQIRKKSTFLFILRLWFHQGFSSFVSTVFNCGKRVVRLSPRTWGFQGIRSEEELHQVSLHLLTWRCSPLTHFWQQTADKLHPIAGLTLRAAGCCLAKIRRPIQPFSWLQLPPRKQSSLHWQGNEGAQ